MYAAHFNGVRLFNSELRRLPDEDYVLERAYIHDVKLTSDDLLVVVETARDRVAAYTARDKERWMWTPRPETKAGDRHHINSVLLSGSRMLASMFAPEPLENALGERLAGAVMETQIGDSSGGQIIHTRWSNEKARSGSANRDGTASCATTRFRRSRWSSRRMFPATHAACVSQTNGSSLVKAAAMLTSLSPSSMVSQAARTCSVAFGSSPGGKASASS